ncbi:hypothetical protein Nepgr_009845 [Nepenthes gracilis]|uniref:Uncharacterized protein n=1 Tax=Nepenthes gracilis TaxID=150966 RepID=A0AAD3SC22_NEPGR|nr:hypothetical protein Nepgr_009845 [Nepenthes gracilis]
MSTRCSLVGYSKQPSWFKSLGSNMNRLVSAIDTESKAGTLSASSLSKRSSDCRSCFPLPLPVGIPEVRTGGFSRNYDDAWCE